MLLADARVVTPEAVLDPGWVRVDGDRITGVGPARPPDGPDAEVVELHGRHLLPGFVDLHVHGGGGASMQSRDPDEVRAAVEFHRGRGTTSLLASLMTAELDALVDVLPVLARLAADGTLVGVHLEGPFLNPLRAGAHDPRRLRPPDAAALDRLVDAGDGSVRSVTVAPELPGGLDLVRRVVDAGAVAAVGHTDATHDEAVAAFAAGATLVTHLFNGMRPFHHREPGVVGAALGSTDVTAELVLDGIHVHDAVARLALAAAPDRIALVTDATTAAGAGDGPATLGDAVVQVRDGAPRLDDGTLAGSVLTMDAAVRRAVVGLGLPLPVAARAAATTPARVLGLADRIGSIAPGRRADLVVLDDALDVEGVMAAGLWITSGTLFPR